MLPELKAVRKWFDDGRSLQRLLKPFLWLVLNQTEHGEIQDVKIAVQKQSLVSRSTAGRGVIHRKPFKAYSTSAFCIRRKTDQQEANKKMA